MSADRTLKRMRDEFESAVQKFYQQTHGIIDINQGQDGISQHSARELLPYALPLIRDETGIDHKNTQDHTTAAENILNAFILELNQDQKAYVTAHKNDYVRALETALHKLKHNQSNCGFELYTDIEIIPLGLK